MRSYGEFVPEDPEEADRRIMFASRGGAHELCNLESASCTKIAADTAQPART